MGGQAFAIPKTRLLDLGEQAAVAVLYGFLVYRLLPSHITPESWYPLILLASEGIVVVALLLRRRTTQISMNVTDWLVAAVAAFAVLCASGGGTPLVHAPAMMLMLAGLAIHCAAKLTLWRSFGVVPAHRGLILEGVYTYVRHPMYAGYLLSHIGFFLWSPTLWNFAVYAIAWTAMIIRMSAEERVLGQDPDYRAYMERVPYRLIPFVY